VWHALRYLVHDFEGGSLLRIEPVRKKRESGPYECVAENGVGDEVSVQANLEIYDGECPPPPSSEPVFLDV
jgi:netrin-G3 ligand